MLDIPEVARDPFRTIWDRLGSSFDLFRFAANARGILDWAVAQSGLEDPLTRFNRQELETLFHKWTRLRDLHLLETLEEAVKQNADMARQRLAAAPAEVKQTVRRLHNKR